ncbi:MAG: hypothetical protein ACM3OB_10275 [Acidobacteriota bacterium]
MRRWPVLLACFATAASHAAFAVPAQELLLAVQGTEIQADVPRGALRSEPRLLLFRDGDFIEIQPGSSASPVATGYMILGRAPASLFAELQRGMVAAQIGRQANCSAIFDADLVAGQLAITWFGAGRRRHTFVVSAPAAGDPEGCSAALQGVLRTLAHIRFLVARDPASVVLVVPR